LRRCEGERAKTSERDAAAAKTHVDKEIAALTNELSAAKAGGCAG
jgi:hypothetical protein